MGFKNYRKQDPQSSPRFEVAQLNFEQTKAQLEGEQKKRHKDRMPLFEAYLELQLKVLSNDQRKANGQLPEYRAHY